MKNFNIFLKFCISSLLFCSTLIFLCSCASVSNEPKEYMVDKFFKKLNAGDIYISMPMDEFLNAVGFRDTKNLNSWSRDHGNIIDYHKKMTVPYSSLIHMTLDRKSVNLYQDKRNGANSQTDMVDVTFFDLDGDWLLGSAVHRETEDDFQKDEVRIFDENYPYELRTLCMSFEKFLVSRRGSPKQKQLFYKLSNGQINGQQFLMEHGRWTGQNMQEGTRVITTQSNLFSSPKPSISARTSILSYEDAKKQTIKRYMNKEITRDECLKVLRELKAQYGK